MAKIYEVLCDYFTDKHDKENNIIASTDLILETEDEQEALEKYEFRKLNEGDLEHVYTFEETDGIGKPYNATEAKAEKLKAKMAQLSKDLSITLENGQHYIEQDEAWERWAKVVDEYERLGGFVKK